MADYVAGLQIINITNPASPTLVGTYDTIGWATDIAVTGDFAFVADYGYGLVIIDITNPTSPTLAGVANAPTYADGVVVDGNLAFVANNEFGLVVVDVTNPVNPTLAGGYNTPGSSRGVAVAGGVAFVADEASGLQIVRVSHPMATPLLSGSYDTPGSAYDVVVAGDLAFVAGGSAGLQIINITNPASPTLIGTYDTPGYAVAIAVAGDLAFVADYSSGLQIISIANPASPTLVGSFNTPGYAQDVAVAGDLAFVAQWGYGLKVINISNPASPTLVGTNGFPTLAMGVAVTGDFAFVADEGQGLRIISISNPASPTLVGTYNTPGLAEDVVVAGGLAFVADGNNLQIIDISNPASPTPVGNCGIPGFAWGIAVAGNLAFVAADDYGLRIIDVANPAFPTPFGGCDTPAFARGVAVSGDHAFVADDNSGLQVIQVFQHEVDPTRNVGRSLAVDASADLIRRARLSATQSAGVGWEVSASNGTNWQAITPNNAWNTFASPGSDLLWRSTLTWAPGLYPAVFDLHLEWLYDSAVIDAITDIANDQGKQVRVEWTRSSHDFVGDATQIVEYAVYRKIDPNLGAVAVPASAASFEHLSPAARENALMMLAAGWDFVTTVPVLAEDSYAVVVPTLKDSTIVAGQYRSTFRVTALTATPGVFFHSPPDSGYSVDNLAPSVPGNFAIAYNTGSGNTLAWDESPNADFQYFRVYRSSDPNFTPSPGTLVHSTVTNGWADPDYDGWSIYYKVTATDFSGNESAPTGGGTVTGIGGSPTPHTFALYPNVPNPFNPTTTIRYDVPSSGSDLSLRIYDVGGRLVKTLVEGTQTAGEKSVTWNGRDDAGRPVASGVYFYRLTAPNYTKTHKMVLMK